MILSQPSSSQLLSPFSASPAQLAQSQTQEAEAIARQEELELQELLSLMDEEPLPSEPNQQAFEVEADFDNDEYDALFMQFIEADQPAQHQQNQPQQEPLHGDEMDLSNG
jgi:hypothetical protein